VNGASSLIAYFRGETSERDVVRSLLDWLSRKPRFAEPATNGS